MIVESTYRSTFYITVYITVVKYEHGLKKALVNEINTFVNCFDFKKKCYIRYIRCAN